MFINDLLFLPGAITERFFHSPRRKIIYYVIVQNIFSILIGTFEIALIYRLTQSLKVLVIAYLFRFSILFFSFALTPVLIHTSKIGRMFKSSIFIQILICAFLIFYYSDLKNIWLLIIYISIRGVQDGVYWIAKHSGTMYSVDDNGRDRFSLQIEAILVTLTVILPIVGGLIISFIHLQTIKNNPLLPEGYFYMFVLTFCIMVVSFIFAPELKFNKCAVVKPKNIISMFKEKDLSYFMYYNIFTSVQDIAVMIAVGVITFLILKTEFNLGMFSSVLSAVAAIYFILIRKYIANKINVREKFFLLGVFGDVVSKLTYYFLFSYTGLIIKAVADTFLVPFQYLFSDNIQKKKMEDVVAKNKSYNIQEILIFQEVLIFIGRFFTLLIILLILHFSTYDPLEFLKSCLLYSALAVLSIIG